MYCDVEKDCLTADNDVVQCTAGYFGGQQTKPLPEHFCRSSEKVFQPSMLSAVCAVEENSAFLGLFHYPRPLVKHRKDFDSTGLGPRHLNHHAYGYSTVQHYNFVLYQYRFSCHRCTRIEAGEDWGMHLFCHRERIGRSRSSKVDDFGTNRKRICDFLLVGHCNHGPSLHRF